MADLTARTAVFRSRTLPKCPTPVRCEIRRQREIAADTGKPWRQPVVVGPVKRFLGKSHLSSVWVSPAQRSARLALSVAPRQRRKLQRIKTQTCHFHWLNHQQEFPGLHPNALPLYHSQNETNRKTPATSHSILLHLRSAQSYLHPTLCGF